MLRLVEMKAALFDRGVTGLEVLNEEMHRRLHSVLRKYGIILGVGIAYAIWCNFSSLRIPCIIHLIFHVECPGCGMTRAAVAMSHMDFATAFEYNKLSVTVIPVLLVLLARHEYRYIKVGEKNFTKFETILLCILLYVTLAYGIIRNLV